MQSGYIYGAGLGAGKSSRLKSKTDDSRRECESLLFAHQ